MLSSFEHEQSLIIFSAMQGSIECGEAPFVLLKPGTPPHETPVKCFGPSLKPRHLKFEKLFHFDETLVYMYLNGILSAILLEPRCEKTGFLTKSHTNRAVQPQKMARSLKFCI